MADSVMIPKPFPMRVRPGTWALAALGAALLGTAGSLVHAMAMQAQAQDRLARTATLIRELPLTDLVLFTEARYTRHPAMADYHAAFQNHPLALETFPSGSLIAPPAHLRQPRAGATTHAP